jgi:GTPase SAR1 family protein
MSGTVNSVLLAVLKTVSSLLPRAVTDGVEQVVDFAYVRVFGLPFVVLGYRQTGKTTLLEWLRHNMALLEEFDPDPTASGGDPVPAFTTRVGDDNMRLRPKRDVGGEYAMWETDWVDLFQQTRPRGIIFMVDHTNVYHHKDALNFVLQMIDDEPAARRNLKTFLLLVNKSDLWGENYSLANLLDDYKNETRRLKSQSERVGYQYFIRSSSLVSGEGTEEAMRLFFNTIRPKTRPVAESPVYA